MTTKNRRAAGKGQRLIAYPPQASASLLETWQRCKLKYAQRIVLLYENGYYYTYGEDAEALVALTRTYAEQTDGPAFSHFAEHLLETVLEALGKADQYWVICDPPEDPTLHIFN